ncbi:MAG: transcriptional regulator, partial [Ornithinimicrobium sp.]
QQLDFFVPDQSVVNRALRLLGPAASSLSAAASIRVAPVPALTTSRVAPSDPGRAWPLAHPLFVALDLAQDPGRGREILDSWTPDPRWTRVW